MTDRGQWGQSEMFVADGFIPYFDCSDGVHVSKLIQKQPRSPKTDEWIKKT
jgi:hypothetical protein